MATMTQPRTTKDPAETTDRADAAIRNRSNRPLILVHGILGQRHVYWNRFRRRLISDGFRVHEAILPYYLLGDMRIAARFLRDKVEATLRGDGADRVDLVCHSAGGLVARYYLKYLGGNKRVTHLITMGTPHQGTYFAYLTGIPVMGMLEIARQTRPGSHFLKEIADAGPSDVRVTNLWSPIDGVVLPGRRAVLEGAHNIRFPLATHWDFLWRDDIHEAVLEALRSPDAAPVTGADHDHQRRKAPASGTA